MNLLGETLHFAEEVDPYTIQKYTIYDGRIFIRSTYFSLKKILTKILQINTVYSDLLSSCLYFYKFL